MQRQLTLRQIEGFKAVIEAGTISNAAVVLNISQPAMSKLIAHLEMDTGLKLFDRIRGRLVPTEHAMRLHGEVGRIFAGVRQVENAVQAIRREEQGRLEVGVMPALAGSFIQRATSGFLKARPTVFCSIQSQSSQWIVDRLVARKLDVGLVGIGSDNPYVTFEPLMEHPLVCILPPNHQLASKKLIEPQDLDQVPFVAFHPETDIGQRVEGMFDTYRVKSRVVHVANLSATVCQFVAAGLGVSLVHPLDLSGLEDRLAVRRFEPKIIFRTFQLCRGVNSGNSELVDAFAQEVRATAAHISRSILDEAGVRRAGRRA